MTSKKNTLKAVPTNIITGFLGVGKSSAILHLLSNKPKQESWAILINEFGEVGIDGSLFEGQYSQQQGIFIREVPGGCMCCAAGLPMQIALNQLLSRAKPDRLLIEPTGLGHPKEVLQILSSDYYQEILSLQKILTLVDARKLTDERYTQHKTFNQQIAIADIIVANKQDLYQSEEKTILGDYINQYGQASANIIFTQYGEIALSQLEGSTRINIEDSHHYHHHEQNKPLISDMPIPDNGFLKASNKGEGFHSNGWRFSPNRVFERNKLISLFKTFSFERMKAVMITGDGIFAYNLTPDALTEQELDECAESRIEIIASLLDPRLSQTLEAQLLECLTDN